MISIRKENKFHLSTSDNRRKLKYKNILDNVTNLLKMEPGTMNDSSVLVIFSYSGYMVTKKLYNQICVFQKNNKKCYIYSEYSNSVREIINIERGDFPDTGIYAVIIHAGMGIKDYNSIQPNIICQDTTNLQ